MLLDHPPSQSHRSLLLGEASGFVRWEKLQVLSNGGSFGFCQMGEASGFVRISQNLVWVLSESDAASSVTWIFRHSSFFARSKKRTCPTSTGLTPRRIGNTHPTVSPPVHAGHGSLEGVANMAHWSPLQPIGAQWSPMLWDLFSSRPGSLCLGRSQGVSRSTRLLEAPGASHEVCSSLLP